MAMTWEQSVQAARAANMKAIEGRFELTLASFAIFPRYGSGISRPGGLATRTLLDWADEVGVNYNTLNGYRQLVNWWFESDPNGLLTEIGVPANIAWEALKLARAHWALSAEFRQLLAVSEPANGRIFTLDDIELLARGPRVRRKMPRRKSSPELFEVALTLVERVGARMTRLLGELRDAELSDEQREQLREAVERARAPLDFLASYAENGESAEAFLAQRDRERLQRAKATNRGSDDG